MIRRTLPWALAVAALWTTAQSQEGPRSHQDDPVPGYDLGQPHSEGEILYALRGPALDNTRRSLRELVGAVDEEVVWRGRIYKLVLPEGADLAAAIDTLNADPRVRYAEPNYTLFAIGIPNDPSFPSQWDFHQASDHDIDAPEAWDRRTSAANIVVGVIDTGVDWNHIELDANIWTNPSEIPGNGIDDDGNGWVDDVHGIDTVNNDGNPDDDNGHGTHCSGTIGAESNNGLGVAGVCWNVQIMGLKFLNSAGSGSTSNAVRCVQYAVDKGANLTSNSWGGGGFSQSLKDAIDLAGAAGQVFCAAAGNSGINIDTNPQYPAAYSSANIVSVASSDINDNRSSFSNYGVNNVDLAAPGSNILSTWPNDQLATLSGTSMACPHVSGVAAMLYAESGTSDPLQVKSWLMDNVDVMGQWSGIVGSGGRLNFDRSLAAAAGGGGGGNNPPTANAGADKTGQTGQVLTFDGSASFDPNGDSLTFSWNFGDGATGSGAVVTHAYAAAGTYVATLTVFDGEFSDSDTAVATITNPPSGDTVYLSLTDNQTLSGVGSVSDEDILSLDLGSGAFTMVVDLSDVGVTTDLNAFCFLANGDILMSFDAATSIPGLIGGPNGTSIDDSDVVRFVPTSLGTNTAGTFFFVFDGSDVGLTQSGEDIDCLGVDASGDLVISTTGTLGVTGLTAQDEDLVTFTATSLGATTAGSFSLLFDGSDVGLSTSSSEDIDAAFLGADGTIYLSTTGNYSVTGLSGFDDDVFTFTPTSLGSNTSGTFALFVDGPGYGLSANDVDGVSVPD